jgi:tripeptidyl-peptidase I
LRTTEYKVPEGVQHHVEYVHPTTVFGPSSVLGGGTSPTGKQFPPFKVPVISAPASNPPVSPQSGLVTADSTEDGQPSIPSGCADTTTPTCLQALYGIPSASEQGKGISQFGMAVTGFINQYANIRDFTVRFLFVLLGLG